MLQLKIQGKKRHNSENVLQEILQQMFVLTARTLNTGLRAFDGIIDDALQHQKRNSTNFTHYSHSSSQELLALENTLDH